MLKNGKKQKEGERMIAYFLICLISLEIETVPVWVSLVAFVCGLVKLIIGFAKLIMAD